MPAPPWLASERLRWPELEGEVALNNAYPQVLHLVTKIERAEGEDAMVEITTLEATSLYDVDWEQMATKLFDILAMTVKDNALRIIQGITNFNGFKAWRHTVARYDFH